jgi:hypothetical protein
MGVSSHLSSPFLIVKTAIVMERKLAAILAADVVGYAAPQAGHVPRAPGDASRRAPSTTIAYFMIKLPSRRRRAITGGWQV